MKKKQIAAETGTAQAPAKAAPKTRKKATRARRGAKGAPAKGKAAKTATSSKKTPKGVPKAAPAPQARTARDGSKSAKILALVSRPGGATAKELMAATNWLPHSVRGFIAGTLRKKMGLNVISAKGENGERSYTTEA